MSHHPTDLAELGRAANVVEQCFLRAVSIIDGKMGPDYAKKNPSLLASVTTAIGSEHQACARDFVFDRLTTALENLK